MCSCAIAILPCDAFDKFFLTIFDGSREEKKSVAVSKEARPTYKSIPIVHTVAVKQLVVNGTVYYQQFCFYEIGYEPNNGSNSVFLSATRQLFALLRIL